MPSNSIQSFVIPSTSDYGVKPMKEYAVEVVETLSRVEYVEADNEDEALDKVREMYFNEVIVLDSSDYDSTDFCIHEE